nr:enhancer of filamentation 1-like [Haemonchus contortus]
MFNQPSGSPFDDPFFRDRPRLLRRDVFDRIAVPVRRMNSCEDALRGVVRNIPIHVEGAEKKNMDSFVGEPAGYGTLNGGPFRRRLSDSGGSELGIPSPRGFRRAMSSGRLSPSTLPKTSNSQPQLSSDDDDRRTIRSDISPHRTLVIPSSVPGGKSIEIPLGSVSLSSSRQDLTFPRNDRGRSPKPESQMEKLTQRLKNLAKPFRSPSRQSNEREKTRCASPTDSSGISADITDSNSGEDTKRASDLSSLSSVDPNSSISDSSEEAKLQPPAVVRHPRQPYLSRLTRENPVSTSVLQTVFDNIERPDIKRFGENNNGKEWMTVPVSVEEDMRRNESPGWNLIPTTVTTPKPRPPVDVKEEAIQSRKRIVCSQMSESLKAIDNACVQISKVTAPQHWRAPHLLQSNLNTLRDAITTAHDALGVFVDGTGRISIDRKNPKAEELDGYLKPLLEARSHLTHLRKNLDAVGWTVSVLSRDSESSRTMDTLDQFIAAIQKVPSDCRRLLQWTQLLVPSPTVVFLSPISDAKIETPILVSVAQPRATDRSPHLLGSPPFLDETKRLSSSSTSTVTSSDSSQPSSILVTKHSSDKPKGRVTFADEPRDRPSATPSQDNGECSKAPQLNGLQRYGPMSGPHRLQETRIIEEDDLESNVSEGENLFQDYAYLDDVVPGRSNAFNNAVNNSISDEDRQLVRFYAPQLDQHTESLSLAVEDFLGTVENNLPPREFVQKGKLIILAAHKLIYIGDTVSQCVGDRAASNSLRQCADRLCELLKECVRATKLASEEYPELKSMQGMIDSIIAVSKTAHEMKVLVKQWC